MWCEECRKSFKADRFLENRSKISIFFRRILKETVKLNVGRSNHPNVG
jgi:hypothetical protein